MLIKFNDFTSDLILESLLLESKLELSDKLLGLLNSMPNGTVRDNLLKIYKNKIDLNITQNYLDISSSKDEITFIPDRRAQQILGSSGEIKWITNNEVRNRYLTFNKDEEGRYKNRDIFNALDFNPEDNKDHVIPGEGSVGIIVRETVSRQSGKTYALFKWDNNVIVLNKVSLDPHDDRYNKVWSQTRNPIRIGRLITAIFNNYDIKISDREKEIFVNQYKSAFDIMNDEFKRFDVVSGDEIADWYNIDNYESTDSTLGSSCMAEVSSYYFNIYTKNTDVCSLVILYGKDGKVDENGKFKGTNIRGRALLWKTEQGDMFMDRIYTNKDSDIELFKQYADENGWWYKKYQNSDSYFYAQHKTEVKKPTYSVKLSISDFDYYPYVDTLTYLNVDSDKISNSSSFIDAEYELEDTDGNRLYI